MNKKTKETELTFDQVNTECIHFDHKSAQIGISVYSIIINKWNEYQSEYLRQKPYRQAKAGAAKECENPDPESVTRVTDRGEERRREKKRGDKEEIRGESERREEPDKSSGSNDPSREPPPHHSSSSLSLSLPPNSQEPNSLREEFLSLLETAQVLVGYPFSKTLDGILFDQIRHDRPYIDIIAQTRTKIEYWESHPDDIKKATNEYEPRRWLKEWLLKAFPAR